MSASGSPAATLAGRFLVAAPSMPDERFQKSVVYICKHDDDGALGIIVNNKVEDLPLGQVYKQLGIEVPAAAAERPVLFGGPVETSRGLVLHSADYQREETLVIDGGMALTASLEILKDMAGGRGPTAGLAGARPFGLGARPARPRDAGQRLARGRRRPDAGVRRRPRGQVAACPRSPGARRARRQVRPGVYSRINRTRLTDLRRARCASCALSASLSPAIGL